jgi:ubiquinol-cytochrome c reductase cytochrome b subunit
MGWLEGALRMMPAWQISFLGHTLSLSVFIPALLVFGLLITGLALYPFLEQWVTGDKREHHVLDRPRDAPTRTAIGMGGVTFYGLLWLIGGNDLIARWFDVQLYWTTWFGRVAIIAGPIIAYFVTKRICLGLQRKDRELLAHGVETGIVMMSPEGEFTEVSRPVPEEKRAVLTARKEPLRIPAAPTDENGVPSPVTNGVLGRLRVRLNHVFAEEIPLPAGDGHGDGHRELAEGAGEQQALPAAERSEPTSRT